MIGRNNGRDSINSINRFDNDIKKNYKKVVRNDFQQKCKAINLMTFLIADSTRISSLRLWCFL